MTFMLRSTLACRGEQFLFLPHNGFDLPLRRCSSRLLRWRAPLMVADFACSRQLGDSERAWDNFAFCVRHNGNSNPRIKRRENFVGAQFYARSLDTLGIQDAHKNRKPPFSD